MVKITPQIPINPQNNPLSLAKVPIPPHPLTVTLFEKPCTLFKERGLK